MSLLTGKISDFLKIGVAAAGRGDLETVQTVLAERPDWLLRAGHTSLMTALRSTIKNKDKLREVVHVLTEAGAELNE